MAPEGELMRRPVGDVPSGGLFVFRQSGRVGTVLERQNSPGKGYCEVCLDSTTDPRGYTVQYVRSAMVVDAWVGEEIL